MAQGLDGLLSGSLNSPALNLGVGLLSAAGPSTVPVSFGQALGRGLQFAQSAEQQSLRNQAIRSQLSQRSQKQAAAKQLQGLLGDQPNGQMLGLLGQMAPGATAQGLLSQMFPRSNSTLQLLDAAGIDRDSKEGQDIIRSVLTGGPKQMDAALKLLQIQNAQRELDTARTKEKREKAGAKISVLGGIGRLEEIATINGRLKGTLGETGIGFNEARAALAGGFTQLVSLFGGDEQRARQVAVDLQRFEQLTTNEAVQSLFTGEVTAGTLTNQKLSTFLKTKPGVDRLPEVNNRITADMLQSKLDSSDKLGIEVPDRARVEQLINELRSGKAQSGKSDASRPARRRYDAQGNRIE